MTATDELRRMLDERGVEWEDCSNGSTYVEYRGEAWRFDYDEPFNQLGIVCLSGYTPEQAIEATLGRGTCSIRGGECDQCGAYIHKDAVLFWVPVDEGMRTVESRDVSYCPNCGRRVVAGDA